MTTPRTPVPPAPVVTPDATAPAAATIAPGTPVSTDPKSEVPGTTELVTVAAPGSADFDVNTDDVEALEKHVRILNARKQLADLAAPAAVATTGTPYVPAPDDVYAVHPELGHRHFSKLAWDTLETKGEHGGWEVSAEKPADLPQA